jgi:transposase
MNKTLPIIHESADALKQRLHQEHDHRKRQRLHALYLLASGQAKNRSAVATLLGLDRNTVGRWLTQYRDGGLAALVAVYVPAGKRPALAPAQLAQLRQRLEQLDGFASYGEIQQWITTTFGVQMGYHAVHTLVHDKLRARPKVARPSHEKKVPRM